MRIIRITLCCLLLLALSPVSTLSEAAYLVDDRPLTGMSVEEFYALEDAIIVALEAVFDAGAKASASGDLIGMYVVNPRTKKFHYPYCYSAIQIGPDRRFEYCAASELAVQGFVPCGQCKPYAISGK